MYLKSTFLLFRQTIYTGFKEMLYVQAESMDKVDLEVATW